jgi:hypothetical protein
MAATLKQRRIAADVLRAGGTQQQAADAAGVSLSTTKRWLQQPDFLAMIESSPDIRVGAPARIGRREATLDSQHDERSRMWVAGRDGDHEVLGSYIPPAAHDAAGAVVHVHVVPPDAVDGVMTSIKAGAYPTESPYIPVPLAGLDEVLENVPLICRLGSSDQRESLMAWLEVWTFIDEYGHARTLADALWDGQRRFLEALLTDGHVLSIKSRKVGLSTLVCAHAAWTARIRDVNASTHLLSYRVDAAQESSTSLPAPSSIARLLRTCSNPGAAVAERSEQVGNEDVTVIVTCFDYGRYLEEAREAGLGVTIHVGEEGGEAGIEEDVELCVLGRRTDLEPSEDQDRPMRLLRLLGSSPWCYWDSLDLVIPASAFYSCRANGNDYATRRGSRLSEGGAASGGSLRRERRRVRLRSPSERASPSPGWRWRAAWQRVGRSR